MTITATIISSPNSHNVVVSTNDQEKTMTIAPKPSGYGSSINGGELLFLSLATCFCNDVYREAERRKIAIDEMKVEVFGHFGGEGEPASGIRYRVDIQSPSSRNEINDLIAHVDRIAEVHNTLRKGISLTIEGVEENASLK